MVSNVFVLSTVDFFIQISSDGNSFKLRTDEDIFVSVVLSAPVSFAICMTFEIQ